MRALYPLDVERARADARLDEAAQVRFTCTRCGDGIGVRQGRAITRGELLCGDCLYAVEVKHEPLHSDYSERLRKEREAERERFARARARVAR